MTEESGTTLAVHKKGASTKLRLQDNTSGSGNHHTWFRGKHVNARPPKHRMQGVNQVTDSVLKGWKPERPMIDHETRITAFGSCFAANISNWLARRNYRILNRDEESKAYVVSMGEGMVNSFVIRQQFEWAWENKVFDQPLWHGYNAEDFGYDEAVRQETKTIFDETDLFILTFGLSEVWYDEPTGNVFWRTIPKDVYDESRHKFRVASPAENLDNMRAIHDLIRKHRPDAKMIFTLSPIPLTATFRDISCITANSTSKASLRVALDELMREKRDEGHVHYWPSYEIVMDIFRQPFIDDNRHVEPNCLQYIMTLFEHIWCEGDEADKPSLIEAWIIAASTAGLLPNELQRIVARRRPDRLDLVIENKKLDKDEATDKAKRRLLVELREKWREEDAAAHS
ncbi:GSCFA domain-containing protein [Pelagovum pacificum]|uniref:GSCFA domain-containing protein n=1 Tax=Pelagovum pacificum TaxID=2588711 RepID=A0A5C5G835_9RHOB|nr:GSCFA domain-containing protein [Pelagovum pacificum]QQA41590.1 GSCFA domain-containing protein [Pelagovum pacificum]TNY30869.1 GSCFA domain-containing protein [Pelagovum pacificum]